MIYNDNCDTMAIEVSITSRWLSFHGQIAIQIRLSIRTQCGVMSPQCILMGSLNQITFWSWKLNQ